MVQCPQLHWSRVATAAVALILLAGGITLLSYYHRDDVHCNAYGYIINVDGCYISCSPDGGCYADGILGVRYRYNETGHNDSVWYDNTAYVGLFCDSDCCRGYMVGNITVYFDVDKDDTVQYISLLPDYNAHALLTFGIILLVLAGIVGGFAVCGTDTDW